jgi:cell division protein FtsW (lipid II flippase)
MPLVSAPAVLLGALVMAADGISARIWGLNIAVWVGMAVWCAAYIIWRKWFQLEKWTVQIVIFLTLASLFSTIWFPSIQGVHRWLYVGPVRLHAAAIFLPVLLLALAWLLGKELKIIACTLTFSVEGLLAYQPDAAQGTAFAFSAGWLLIRRGKLSRTASGLASGALLICLILAWLQPDPLPAVVYVEGVVGMAARISAGLAIVCIGALAMLLLPYVWVSLRSRAQPDADLGIAFAIYFGVTMLGSALRNFPVPILGYGASPIIGYFIAIGWLANRKLDRPVPDVRSGLPGLL